MIRFSAIVAVVVVALGLLIAGAVSGTLMLVYLAIAVAGLALVLLITGVLVWRDEIFGKPTAAQSAVGLQEVGARPEQEVPVGARAGGRAAAPAAATAPAYAGSGQATGFGQGPGQGPRPVPAGQRGPQESPARDRSLREDRTARDERERREGQNSGRTGPGVQRPAHDYPPGQPAAAIDSAGMGASVFTPREVSRRRPPDDGAKVTAATAEPARTQPPARREPPAEPPARPPAEPGATAPAAVRPGQTSPAVAEPGGNGGPDPARPEFGSRPRVAATDLPSAGRPAGPARSARSQPSETLGDRGHSAGSVRPSAASARPQLNPLQSSSPLFPPADSRPAAGSPSAAGLPADRPAADLFTPRRPSASGPDADAPAASGSPADAGQALGGPAASERTGQSGSTGASAEAGRAAAAAPAGTGPTTSTDTSGAPAAGAASAGGSSFGPAAGSPTTSSATKSVSSDVIPASDRPAAGERPAGDPAGPRVTVVPGIARYHMPDCILIRFLGAEDLQAMALSEAEQSGCVPCRACRPEKELATP